MSKTYHVNVSRRAVLAGAGAGAGLMGMSGATLASVSLLPAPDTSETYDVVVIGSGIAGCAAALQAAEAGAKVVLLEKMQSLWMGGNSLLAGGGFAMPLEATEASRRVFVEEYEAYCLGRGNSMIFKLMAENIDDDLAWLQANGVAFEAPTPWPPNQIRMAIASPGFFSGMPHVFRRMRTRLPELGVELRFETKAQQLVMNDAGAVAGVRAVGRAGVVDYLGKSVVIATGGYAGNTALLEAYSDPNAGAMMVRGIKHATGDGLLMAQQAGAGLKGMGGLMALHIAAVDGVETAAGQPASVVPHAISINREGKRFVDESKGYVNHGKAVLNQPGQSTSLVFDQTLRDSVAEGVMTTFARLGLTVHQAETLEGLAALIGVPEAQFVQTVAEFNAAVVGNAAPGATPPKEMLANRIETPPFYAFSPLVPGITLTFGGIMINDRAQALEADGRVIPGLFAAGEGAGAAFFHDYIGGGSLTNCLVMGRIAGRQAAA
ncbi:MAG: FAD-dependent oxidoreductase [Rhodobacteraceae bacterium]|nr:FAD-dependent oxidoreductase [Paracoccaceae bacterium]